MSRQGFPCCDWALRLGERPGLCARNRVALARLGRTCDKHARLRQRHLALCRDRTFVSCQGLGLGLGDQGHDRGFHVATESLWPYVATVDYVATGCGQGQETLCRDMETTSRQGAHQLARQACNARRGAHVRRYARTIEELCRDRVFPGSCCNREFSVATENVWPHDA